MLLLTGATGSIGSRLLPLLLESGEDVRCLVREPRRLGERRVDVQIALGDLGEMSDPYLVRQALRGVDTVIHLAATIRDQPPKRIEELNGLATVRLLRAAERSGVERFHFFSALDAGAAQRTRFFRAKWLAEQAVALLAAARRPSSRPRSSTTTATPGSPCCAASPSCRCCRSPATARRRFQPIWAEDVARCVVARAGAPSRGPALRAGRAGDAHLRPDVGPGQPRSPAGRGRSSTCRCRWSAPA